LIPQNLREPKQALKNGPFIVESFEDSFGTPALGYCECPANTARTERVILDASVRRPMEPNRTLVVHHESKGYIFTGPFPVEADRWIQWAHLYAGGLWLWRGPFHRTVEEKLERRQV
jgi:hypothetical protein